MSVLPASGFISNAARTEGEVKTALEDVRDVIAELLGGSIETELTIAAGSVTPTAAIHSIDTEADAASDDLANILQTNHPDGRLLLIHANDGARDVVVKHSAGGAGQIIMRAAADVLLDTTDKYLLLKRTGTNWDEIAQFFGLITTFANLLITGSAPSTPVAKTLYENTIIKMWCKWTSVTTTAITDDVNVASLTDEGTGDTTVTIETDFDDGDYGVGTCSNTAGSLQISAQAAGSARFQSKDSTGTNVDASLNMVIAVGEN